MTRVHDPKPGYRYSLAVHGEPPEGEDVLWHGPRSGGWWPHDLHLPDDTHWMLAPTPAPAVEEAVFEGLSAAEAEILERDMSALYASASAAEAPPFPGVRSDYGDIREGR